MSDSVAGTATEENTHCSGVLIALSGCADSIPSSLYFEVISRKYILHWVTGWSEGRGHHTSELT